MVDQEMQLHRFEVRPTADTHFGWLRTRLSVERTLMSWVRTAMALIGFGFTIVQFFEHLHAIAGAAAPSAAGTPVSGTGTHRDWCVRAAHLDLAVPEGGALPVEQEYEPVAGLGDVVRVTPLYAVAIVLILIGLFAFGAVFIRAV